MGMARYAAVRVSVKRWFEHMAELNRIDAVCRILTLSFVIGSQRFEFKVHIND